MRRLHQKGKVVYQPGIICDDFGILQYLSTESDAFKAVRHFIDRPLWPIITYQEKGLEMKKVYVENWSIKDGILTGGATSEEWPGVAAISIQEVASFAPIFALTASTLYLLGTAAKHEAAEPKSDPVAKCIADAMVADMLRDVRGVIAAVTTFESEQEMRATALDTGKMIAKALRDAGLIPS